MRLAFCWLTFIFLSFISVASAQSNYKDSAKAASLIHIQQLLLDDQFDSVNATVSTYLKTYPNDPAGYLFRASELLARMSDQEENLYPVEFKAALDTVEVLASQLDTSSARNRAWKHLWLGHAKAYGSVYASRFGSFTSAIGMGFDAKDEYHRGMKEDSTLADLSFGLGSYHYWKSAKAGILRWIGIFRNDKERGIEELWRAARYSDVSRDAALSALIWVYFEDDRYDSAVQMTTEIQKQFPNGKSFLWPLAKGHLDQKNYREAIVTFQQLRERLMQSPGNYYNVIECDYEIVQGYRRLGVTDSAAVWAQKGLEYESLIPKSIRERQKNKLNHLKRMAKWE